MPNGDKFYSKPTVGFKVTEDGVRCHKSIFEAPAFELEALSCGIGNAFKNLIGIIKRFFGNRCSALRVKRDVILYCRPFCFVSRNARTCRHIRPTRETVSRLINVGRRRERDILTENVTCRQRIPLFDKAAVKVENQLDLPFFAIGVGSKSQKSERQHYGKQYTKYSFLHFNPPSFVTAQESRVSQFNIGLCTNYIIVCNKMQ